MSIETAQNSTEEGSRKKHLKGNSFRCPNSDYPVPKTLRFDVNH